MLDDLKSKKIILASNSPRRRELLGGLGIEFEVRVLPDIDEAYPDNLPASEVALYIAREKAVAYKGTMSAGEIVITADTVVIHGDRVLGKPVDDAEAVAMLSELRGCTHQVITGVCITGIDRQTAFSVTTDVTFRDISDEEISYYVNNYHPLDKAGAYGIQEWIGYIGVTKLEGSYYNVMGLPVQRIYNELKRF
ncbi:Maf-like protein [Xylanibacter muris]|uniref:dTTP/UTP pyrophosphatase n=1 Tax=Xylanibacter muris TaxID=2736290 RepID=A0ABX2AJU1_9BACT|nr:Maf-like protein [Xylanibacter muris]NPD91441.1 septum formation protein Maf [Xylanibacter muris]